MQTSAITASRSPLRILFAVREDLRSQPGGDTVQIINTAAALGDLGVTVVVSSNDETYLADFDCVHLWHLERVHETYIHLLRARAAGKPIVLSPIYWPRGNYDGRKAKAAVSWREDAKNIWRYVRARSARSRRATGLALKTGWARCRRDILESAAVILPNSQAEAAVIAQEMGRTPHCRIVPNGINVEACQAVLDHPLAMERQGVVCVGHFDVRKNQLALIQALRDTDIPITFVGGARPMHQAYYRRCRRLAGPYMNFLGPQTSQQVLQLLRRARVHVCPSRFETPGLANLEAAVMGCNLALADCPPVREYFREDAVYFGCDDADGVRAAVQKALQSPPVVNLAERVRAEFNWTVAARITLEAYLDAVANRASLLEAA